MTARTCQYLRILKPSLLLICIMVTSSCALLKKPINAVEYHGALSVAGNKIVNHRGKSVSFAGPSLFWGNKGWGGEAFYHEETVQYVKERWHASIIRVSMGVETDGGLIDDWEGRLEKIHTVVDAAIKHNLYVIIDFHSHHAEEYLDTAVRFFTHMAQRYGNHPHVLYEIFSEPLDSTDWSNTVKPYAEKVIHTIRAIDPDNLIIVGTQTWGQDVEKAAKDPLNQFSNIVYSLHFYAGTDGQFLRNKAKQALDKGIALMATEWGAVDADADGKLAKEETLRWMDFLYQNKISHCNWAFNNKDEGASVFREGTDPQGPWSDLDLTETGLLVKDIIKGW